MHCLMRYILYLYRILTQSWKMASKLESKYSNTVVCDSAEQREIINRKAEGILEEYGNSILRLAYSYLHSLADAEDVLQDTLIQYIRSAPTIENATHEKAWLLRVAINISKNKIKYKKRRDTTELDEGLVSVDEQDLQFVWEAVKNLPIIYSEVLHLFYHEDYSTAQIASILTKKETTVRSLLHRAREKLKIILKEEYDFAE